MSKDKISDYSSTANSNTDIAAINIDEGCAPSGINNAIRALMAQLKNFQTGASGDSFNGPIGSITPAAGAFTTLSASSTVTLNGGTANGVPYLNGSKVLTTGSALTYDGTNLGLDAGGGAGPAYLTVSQRSRFGYDGTNVLISDAGTGKDIVFSRITEQMRLTSTGLGIGTSSPAYKLDVEGTANTFISVGTTGASSGRAVLFLDKKGTPTKYNWLAGAQYNVDNAFEITPSTAVGGTTFSTPAVVITQPGNLGIGTSSPGAKLHVSASTSNNQLFLERTGSATGKWAIYAQSNSLFFNDQVAATDRMIIDSSGNLLVGATAAIASERLYVNGSNANYLTRTYNSNASPYGALFSYTGAAPNGTANEFFRCDDTGAVRMTVRSNGGIANFSANNVNLSDQRTKTDIQNAGGYLAKICAIPVRTFKYKDQTDDLLNLGVIAQEVETVAPELVDISGFGETPEDGVPLKAIYQTDLQYALMKCIQEQQAIIESLKARLDAANL